MKILTTTVISILFLVAAQATYAKPSITKLLKKGGKVVAIDTAPDPKTKNTVQRVWIHNGKRLWMCYIEDEKDSACIRQQ